MKGGKMKGGGAALKSRAGCARAVENKVILNLLEGGSLTMVWGDGGREEGGALAPRSARALVAAAVAAACVTAVLATRPRRWPTRVGGRMSICLPSSRSMLNFSSRQRTPTESVDPSTPPPASWLLEDGLQTDS